MADEVRRCIQFLRRLEERCAERVEPWQYGTAFFQPSLPRVWSLNFLRVEQDGVAAEALAEEADRVQGGARLEHRRVAAHEDAAGARLAEGFGALGWKVDPLLVMPYATNGRRPDTSEIVEIGRDDVAPAWVEGLRGSPGSDDAETVRQLLAQRSVIAAAGRARYFARLVGGAVAAYCELYSDGVMGQIEGVQTLTPFRGRGFASAVVAKALAESQAAGHKSTFLLALENDWPKELYRKLGFRAVGRIWDFLREPSR
jgi:ribosomal protein S18 acetylase RimI-like enzyme